jgi:hypothetical protein
MTGSHEVRGSIPLSSTTYIFPFEGMGLVLISLRKTSHIPLMLMPAN